MENNMSSTSTIDLTMLGISLIAIKEELGEHEFEDFLDLLIEANDKEKLVEFLDRTAEIRCEGTDLASSLNHAHYDLLVDQGGKIDLRPKK